ncbi:DnaD domain protein [Romboutsia weinsteinii]|uniref:DnaD domain protein n=1 Tax=Romboutsia weinsteinii TaxID=2020949 RepID=A0A371J3T0_9FIRM|nr:DnaD domain protein [Romboutsia weinsteinii]RDY27429.1 DnaD domain protein [Romboutsia weinsteinii]
MAIFRQVEVAFWKDDKVMLEMTPEDKLFFLYLMTNPNTTQIGVYNLNTMQMAFELGYSNESVKSLLDRFENDYKLIKYNYKTKEVAIKNWGRYNFRKLGKPMIDCIKKDLGLVKDTSLLKFVIKAITRVEVIELFNERIGEIFEKDNGRQVYKCINEAIDDRYQKIEKIFTIRGQEEEKEEEQEKEEYIEREEYKKLFEENIGKVNGVIEEWITYISQEIDIHLFKKAIEIASNKDKCSKVYVNGIINQWINLNIKTIKDLEIYLSKNRGNTNGFKYAGVLQGENEQIYKKPSEEQLRRAEELLIS